MRQTYWNPYRIAVGLTSK